jgi:hypothetical protein
LSCLSWRWLSISSETGEQGISPDTESMDCLREPSSLGSHTDNVEKSLRWS